MADYKTMYQKLFNAVTDAIKIEPFQILLIDDYIKDVYTEASVTTVDKVGNNC